MLYNNKNFQTTEVRSLQELVSLISHKTNFAPRLYGRGYRLRCPAHNDKNPSLSISVGHDGRILLHCFTGCALEEICNALGIRTKDLYPKTTSAA